MQPIHDGLERDDAPPANSACIEGTPVLDPAGTLVGKVRHVLIDPASGNWWLDIVYWSRLHTRRSTCRLPCSALSYDPDGREFRTTIPADACHGRPFECGDATIWSGSSSSVKGGSSWDEPFHWSS